MMIGIIDLYDAFGNRFGYYYDFPPTIEPKMEPKINIKFGLKDTGYKTFYLETETAGYVSPGYKKYVEEQIFDKDGNQIGVICLDQEYGEYEIRIQTPAICNGRHCVFKERVVHEPLLSKYIRMRNRLNEPYKIPKSMLTPTTKVDRIVFNDPATIVFWKDGTKTIVKCSDNEDFNPYFGFCAAVAKRVFGNNSQVRKMVESGYFQDTNDGKVKQKTITKNVSTKKSKKEKSKNG
jgi:hypothetical protein